MTADDSGSNSGVAAEVVPPSSTTTTTFKLNIFFNLELSQNNHGITHQDYVQYSKYCTSKLSRLRHVKPVRTLLVHNPKYGGSSTTTSTSDHHHGSSNKRRQHCYVKRDYEMLVQVDDGTTSTSTKPVIKHENILWNLLYQSERAWAQACALQQQQQEKQKPGSLNLKQQQQQQQQQPKSKHGHVQRRLNKAMKYATALVDLVTRNNNNTSSDDDNSSNKNEKKTCCDERTILECQAYLGWMKGNVELEHKNYVSAFRNYKDSLIILLELANSIQQQPVGIEEDAKQQLTLQDLWTKRAETIIRPLVRYCQYEAKDRLTNDDLIIPTGSTTTLVSTTGTKSNNDKEAGGGGMVLTFRGVDAYLDKDPSYKKLAVLYLKMESSLKHPGSLLLSSSLPDSDSSESQFIQLLSDLDDAIALAQTEYNHYNTSDDAGPNIILKRKELQAIIDYFKYQKLIIWRYQQEERILQIEKEQDGNDPEIMVHAYDALLQNAQATADLLSSPRNNTNSSNKKNQEIGSTTSATPMDLEEDAYWLEAQAHIVRIRAFRCYHLARLYEISGAPLIGGGTSKHVLALLKQAKRLSTRAKEEMAAIMEDDEVGADGSDNKNEIMEQYISKLDQLENDMKVVLCRVKATQYLEKSGSGGGMIRTNRPLWLRLDELDGGIEDDNNNNNIASLVDAPPLPIPMPCKGTFYDIAWQHIGGHFPIEAIEQVIADNEPKKQGGGGGGFLSWLTG